MNSDSWVLYPNKGGIMTFCLFVKRIFDFTISLITLIMLLPVLSGIALLIKMESAGPVFFRQERVGRDGRLFKVFKFRSMVDGAVNKGAGILIEKEDSRITKVGAFLRRTSLDEIPQLINVLKGEMSLIGPRPTLQYQVEKYTDYQRKRLKMKPGITGWAQVNGRNSLTWPQRIELDVWYVENWSLLLDLSIFLKTFRVLFKSEGIYDGGKGDDISRTDKPSQKSTTL